MIPRATYRFQFHKGFPFGAAVPLLSYLQRLGISHVYSSPILLARPGSVHCYDVINHGIVNPELGGEDGFRRLAGELREHRLGLILDIVPNHMAIDEGNRWWTDVLAHGARSPFANYFDIDWDAFGGKILLPILGKPYGEALQDGDIRLLRDARTGALTIAHFDRTLPVRPENRNLNVSEFQTTEQLHTLLENQHYRLAWWRTANDTINWRRFFDIPDLIAVKQEAEEVFQATHAKVFELCRLGLIDGVRVDHVDGLADPAAYCRRLRVCLNGLGAQRSPPDAHPYIVVEKILGRGEELPDDWGVDGTSGYDFMNQVSALQHDPAGGQLLGALWNSLSGRSQKFDPEETEARAETVTSSFESALSAAVDSYFVLAQSTIGTRDIARPAILRALVHIFQQLRVYRTYANGEPTSPAAGRLFDSAVSAATAETGGETRAAVEFIADIIQRRRPDLRKSRVEAVRRFNQLAAPVTAKAVEDTAFYRYGRLLSRNDVGFHPDVFSLSVEEFHSEMSRRAKIIPNALLATATHDHKRGEDVRARLAVLSEIPDEWRSATEIWRSLNAPYRPAALDSGDEYQLYQTLVGAWPLDLRPANTEGLRHFSQRVGCWQGKALREAKLRSSWLDPNLDYEASAGAFLRTLLDPGRSALFLSSLTDFVGRIAPAGALNSLVQTALRCCLPGVPDCYQGSELWDFSLVDPDNRRPVDYNQRAAVLGEAEPTDLLRTWQDGRLKQQTIAQLLKLRQRASQLFRCGSYEAIPIDGERNRNVMAFMRHWEKQIMVVAVPLHCNRACGLSLLPSASFWKDTSIPLALGGERWGNLFDQEWGSETGCASLFARFPLAVLINF